MGHSHLLIKNNVALSGLSWLKIGGSADYFAEISTKDELIKAFEYAKENDLPVVYLGQGSNMIFPDEGIRGLIAKMQNAKWKIKNKENDILLLQVEGGLPLGKLIRDCQKKYFYGLDPWMGIPGTVGAAVAGNAGIPGHETKDIVESVEIFDGNEFRILSSDECQFRYRGSKIRDEKWLVWSANLNVEKGKSAEKEILLDRVSKQPCGLSCGSFFKNPPGNYAGKLIEDAGLKGRKIGGAYVSEKHANFLINDGTAMAADFLKLAQLIKKNVLEKHGVLLENEVLLYDKHGKLIDI